RQAHPTVRAQPDPERRAGHETLPEAGDERPSALDGAPHALELQGGAVARLVHPHLGDPDRVGVAFVLGDDVGEAARHPRDALPQRLEQLVALACRRHHLADEPVHARDVSRPGAQRSGGAPRQRCIFPARVVAASTPPPARAAGAAARRAAGLPPRPAAVRRRAAPAGSRPGTRRRGLTATARPGGRRRGAPRGRREPPATWKGWSRMPPVRRLAAALLCAATLLASGAMAQSGTLEIAVDTAPVGLDPHKVTAFSSFVVIGQIYDGLLEVNADLSLEPALAESWTVSDDGLTYVFQIRQGVQFHNDRTMTADDVVYSYERIVDPETASPQASRFAEVESAVATGEYEVTFTLSRPFAPFLSNVTNLYVVPREVVERLGDLQQQAVG